MTIRESRPGCDGTALETTTTTVNRRISHPATVEWPRRSRAAQRLSILDHGVVDPWVRPRPQMSAAMADALLAAARHLETAGLRPIFDVHDLDEAWKLLPESRSQIERLARREAA